MREHLIAMRELLSDPSRWTKGQLARNTHGEVCYPTDSEATCFCLYGAAVKIADDEALADELLEYLRPFSVRTKDLGPVAFNDNGRTTHADILKLLDEAIASC